MAKYNSFDPECEVIGMSMLAVLRSINAEEYIELVQKHDLEDIQPDEWYPLQKWLDFLSDFDDSLDSALTFVSIGLEIASQLPQLEGFDTYEEILMNHPSLYHSTHRNGDDGYYQIDKLGEGKYKVTTRLPYPDDLVYGSLYGEARRYLPSDKSFTVAFDEDEPQRDEGGDKTIINIAIS